MGSTGHQVMVRFVAAGDKGDTYHLECVCGKFSVTLVRTDEDTAKSVAARHERLSS